MTIPTYPEPINEGENTVSEIETPRRWNVTAWRDRNGETWSPGLGGTWVILQDRSEPGVSLDEVRRQRGPLTAVAVDDVAALLAELDAQIDAHAETVDGVMAEGWHRAADEMLCAVPMPGEYTDPNVRTRMQVATYLHGAGAGDAGMQVTLIDDAIERAVCLRLPGPVAEEWLTAALRGLQAARRRAVVEPWGPDETEVSR